MLHVTGLAGLLVHAMRIRQRSDGAHLWDIKIVTFKCKWGWASVYCVAENPAKAMLVKLWHWIKYLLCLLVQNC